MRQPGRAQTLPGGRLRTLCFAVAALLGLAPGASAITITPSAFGSTALVESFEGLAVGPNVAASPYGNIVEPGSVGPFTFTSGIVLTSPVPNPGTLNNGVFVHDFSLGSGASNNWAANGVVASAADVPLGTAYLGAFDNATGGTAPVSLSLRFASDVLRVGAVLTGAPGLTLRLDAYDANDVLLESATIATVPVTSWMGNFLGIERTEGIRRIVFSGADFGIDALRFEAAPVNVPEPEGLALIGVGLGLLAIAGRHRGPRLRDRAS
jgi:hypothetical protein